MTEFTTDIKALCLTDLARDFTDGATIISETPTITGPVFTTAWAMPSRWTFEIPPISDFLDRWLNGCDPIVDPFSGRSTRGHFRNDITNGGKLADEWCADLLAFNDEWAAGVLFDPPYSPRQVQECYKEAGLKTSREATQTARLYKNVRTSLKRLLRPGGIALSFGWNSTGFGKDWETLEILLVRHGGAHNDTICVAQRKPLNRSHMG